MRRQSTEHWDATYRAHSLDALSWYQAEPRVSLELIAALGIPHEAAVVDVGSGSSLLADRLIELGFSDVSVLDISAAALDAAGLRLGSHAPTQIREDVLAWRPSRQFDLWHDRAVFHFLIEEAERRAYVQTMHAALGPGAGVVIATFAPDGPTSCSGLAVTRYSVEQLRDEIGSDLTLVESRREEHMTPRGTIQPFTWIACRLGAAQG